VSLTGTENSIVVCSYITSNCYNGRVAEKVFTEENKRAEFVGESQTDADFVKRVLLEDLQLLYISLEQSKISINVIVPSLCQEPGCLSR